MEGRRRRRGLSGTGREPEGGFTEQVCIKEKAEWREGEGHWEQLPGHVKQEPVEAPEHGPSPDKDHMVNVHIKQEVVECEGGALQPSGESGAHAQYAGRVVAGELVLEPVCGGGSTAFFHPPVRVKREETGCGAVKREPEEDEVFAAVAAEGAGAGGDSCGGARGEEDGRLDAGARVGREENVRLYAGLVVWAEPDVAPAGLRGPLGVTHNAAAAAARHPRATSAAESRPFVCDACGKIYKRRRFLIHHIRYIHHNEGRRKPYECTICNKAFARSDGLRKHKLTHTKVKRYSCDVCNEQFRRLDQFKLHQLSHTGGAKAYSCELCKKEFTRSDHLNIHMRKHTGVKPYTCDICKQGYPDIKSWKTHKLSHTGEKPYSCEMCQKEFTRSDHLRSHKRIHTGVKPYVCEICNEAFTYGSALKIHKRGHTGDKPFTCEICIKEFASAHDLKRHIRIHASEKPFSCQVCEKKFTQSCNLKAHSLTHMAAERFSCETCKKQFVRSDYLIHQKTHQVKKT